MCTYVSETGGGLCSFPYDARMSGSVSLFPKVAAVAAASDDRSSPFQGLPLLPLLLNDFLKQSG